MYHSVRDRSLVSMLKALVVFCLVGPIVAFPPQARSKEDIEELKNFLVKTTQDDGTTLEERMAHYPKGSVWENSGKYQGDIVLFDEEIEEMVAEYAGNNTKDNRNGLVPERHRWPGGVIYYDVAANTFNQHQLQMIQTASNFFHDTTCTRWVRRTNQRDYVYITGRNDGCYATVGFWEGHGQHTLNLADGCFQLSIIRHEMMHSAGFHHMHQTYNRDEWVWIDWDNVEWGMRHNFDIYSNQVVSMLGLPYEYASNMHYVEWAFTTNGRPTIIARYETHGQMGQTNYMTGWDIWRLARLYNCPGAWRVQPKAEDANKPYDDVYFGRMLKAAAEEDIKERVAMLDQAIADDKKNLFDNEILEVNVIDSLKYKTSENQDASIVVDFVKREETENPDSIVKVVEFL